ncbi:MAG: HesA/MoeB/ThiF family protein [Desulfobulbus sp.]|jgi:molybdopterin/thiamine biosynthesis adenylyltransferase
MDAFFSRHAGLLGANEQERLQEAAVAVFGCGGLGGYVVEQLVRVGVGRLVLFDPDSFSMSNLNRQLLATQETLGCNKSEVAAARVQQLRPECQVASWPMDLRDAPETAWQGIHLAMDCLDSAAIRLHLASLCSSRQIPLVHGAVQGWYGQVGVQLPGDDLISSLYPHAQTTAAPVSVFSFTVGCVASLQVCEAVKLLLGWPSLLTGRFASIDLSRGEWDMIAAG